MKKLTTILLLIAMLLPLASCASGGKSESETTSNVSAETDTAVSEDTAETETTRENYEDGLPEKDFGGKTFTVLGYDFTYDYLYAEDLTGDSVNDALYNRNIKVADRFGIKIDIITGGEYTNVTSLCNNSVAAGEDLYNLVTSHVVEMGSSITKGLYQALSDLPYIDFTKPWWSDNNVTDLSYRGKTFLAVGDFDLSTVGITMCTFYNKDLSEEFGYPSIYETVRNGQWTKDKINELCEGTYMDVNGDGQRDAGDRYGYAIDSKGDADAYYWGFGKKLMTKNDNDTYDDTFYDEKLVSMIEWLYDIKNNHDYTWTDENWNTGYNAFILDNTLIACGYVSMALWGLRDLDIDFAILPLPKWDEAQQEYSTVVGGSHDIQGVLITMQDKELTGCITEALNAETWRTVTPAYYDSTLKYKGTRDEDSLEMLDILMAGRCYDFGYVYGGWDAPSFYVHKVLDNNKSKDITSYYEKNKAKWETYFAKIVDAFEKYTNA